VQDVESYFYGKSFDCDGWLTSSEVDSFIATQAQYINIIIKSKYTLPISNQDDLQFLKLINEQLVVGTIDEMDRVSGEKTEFVKTRNLIKRANDILDRLRSGEMRLNSSSNGSNIKFNNTDSDGNAVKKRFKESNVLAPNEDGLVSRETRTIIITD
jgi:hypothetical protein